MSNKRNILFSVWKNPRSRNGLVFVGAGVLFFFFGGRDLLQDASNEAARWIMYIGFAIFLPGFMLLLTLWRREMRVLGLRTAGSTIRGRVGSMKKDRLSQGYVLKYSFNDSMGRTYQGKELLFQQEAFAWREGDEGEIRHDPNDPRVSVWIGRDVEFDEEGMSATVPGTVIEVTERNSDGGRKTVVRYRYRDHLGEIHEDQFGEKEGASFRIGDTGKVAFAPRYPTMNEWLGTAVDLRDVADFAEGKPPEDLCVEAPPFVPGSAPSRFTLFKRCIPLRRSLANLVWFLFYGLILLAAFIVVTDEPTTEAWIGLAVFCLGLLVFFWFGVLRNFLAGKRQLEDWHRLLNLGTPVEGTVTLVEEKRDRWGRWTWKPGWIVSYRYESPNGRFHYGDSGYLSRKEAADWRIRDKCVVLYDHKEPSKSVWIGKP